MSRAAKRLVLLLTFAAVLGAGVGTTLSAFSDEATNSGNSFEAAPSFASSFSIATSAFDLRDAADGSEANESQNLGFNDARFRLTKTWATTAASNRYLDLNLSKPVPGGRSVSSANLNLKLASQGGKGSGNACFYFEIRRASTNAVLGTRGSSSTPVACSSGATQTLTTTDISSEVTSTDTANDLRIRVFGWETGGKGWNVDLATVTGSSSGTPFTLYTESDVDAADTALTKNAWRLAAADDGFFFETVGNWANTFSATRYLKLTFPAYVPAGATVTAASLKHAYRPRDSGETQCWYFEVYSGTTLLGTHGSSAAPISCNSSTTTNQVDTVSLPQIDTAAKANDVVVKIYLKSSSGKRSRHDLAKLDVTYSQ